MLQKRLTWAKHSQTYELITTEVLEANNLTDRKTNSEWMTPYISHDVSDGDRSPRLDQLQGLCSSPTIFFNVDEWLPYF